MEAKIDFSVFSECFFRMRFCIDLGWFLGGSKPEKSIKTIVFSYGFCYFSQNRRFRKRCEKTSILESFSEGEKSRKNDVEKQAFFKHHILSVFFSDFDDFGSILGGPGTSKNWQKIEKIVFGTVLERVSDPLSILEAILERF